MQKNNGLSSENSLLVENQEALENEIINGQPKYQPLPDDMSLDEENLKRLENHLSVKPAKKQRVSLIRRRSNQSILTATIFIGQDKSSNLLLKCQKNKVAQEMIRSSASKQMILRRSSLCRQPLSHLTIAQCPQRPLKAPPRFHRIRLPLNRNSKVPFPSAARCCSKMMSLTMRIRKITSQQVAQAKKFRRLRT
ncbi:hypothetical protein FGO68_gene11917 [Halteria grandinella]|uniref:Uncharacterized protein n=1 Tax=Halteria grandinella TaxID=5974 RepID=A0A8J8NGS6_HALGN|nr:hypothetical protein FGO68_gene11917 [Halteria grandinella]